MLSKNMVRVYNKFKLHLYSQVLRDLDDKDEEALSVQEVIYLELITVLRRPTINDFAHYAKLSGPNAAYRISRLINKGYIEKIQSTKDKREFHLRPTPKYKENYGSIYGYIDTIAERVNERFTPEETALFDRMLGIVASELMPEMHSLNTNRIED